MKRTSKRTRVSYLIRRSLSTTLLRINVTTRVWTQSYNWSAYIGNYLLAAFVFVPSNNMEHENATPAFGYHYAMHPWSHSNSWNLTLDAASTRTNRSDPDASPLSPPGLHQPLHLVVVYTLAYSVVFLLGVVGNVVVLFVVRADQRALSVTNHFIVNLALADILVCVFCLPVTLVTNLFTGMM